MLAADQDYFDGMYDMAEANGNKVTDLYGRTKNVKSSYNFRMFENASYESVDEIAYSKLISKYSQKMLKDKIDNPNQPYPGEAKSKDDFKKFISGHLCNFSQSIMELSIQGLGSLSEQQKLAGKWGREFLYTIAIDGGIVEGSASNHRFNFFKKTRT